MPTNVYPNETPVDVYGINKVEGDIALEMEVEGESLPNIRTKFWQTHNDGSLRVNGVEYVNNGPVKKDKVLEGLLNWEARLVKSNSIVYESDRTSVHVHMNMQDKTFKQILQGCVAYYILENALMRHCGPNRVTNLFCLPLKQSKSQLTAFKYLAGAYDGGSIRTDSYRYSALNLMALMKFGSIEHRGMRGYYEPEFLNEWALGLKGIFDTAASDFKSPIEVLDHYYGRSFKDYAGTFLPSSMVDTLSKTKDWDIDKDSNMAALGSVVYHLDYDKTRPKNEKIEKKSPNPFNDATFNDRVLQTMASIQRRSNRPLRPTRTERHLPFGIMLTGQEFNDFIDIRYTYYDWLDAKEKFTTGQWYYDDDYYFDEDDEGPDERQRIYYEDPGEQPENTRQYTYLNPRSHDEAQSLVSVLFRLYPQVFNEIEHYQGVLNPRESGLEILSSIQDYLRQTSMFDNGNKFHRLTHNRGYLLESKEELAKDFLHFLKHEGEHLLRVKQWDEQNRPQIVEEPRRGLTIDWAQVVPQYPSYNTFTTSTTTNQVDLGD